MAFNWDDYEKVPAQPASNTFNWDDHPIVTAGPASDPSTSAATAASAGFLNAIPFSKQIGAASKTAMDAATGVTGPLAGGSLSDLVDEYRSQRDDIDKNFAKAIAAHPAVSTVASIPAAAMAGSAMPGGDAIEQAGVYGGALGLSDSKADLTKGEVGPAAWDTLKGAATAGATAGAVPYVGKAIGTVGNAIAGSSKRLLSATLGPSTDAIDAYLDDPAAINGAKSYPEQAENLATATNALKGQIGNADTAAIKTLGDTPTVGKQQLIQGLDDIDQSLYTDGNLVGSADKAASKKITDLMGDVGSFGDNVSEQDLKRVIQSMDQNINWDDPSLSRSNQVLSQARTFFDGVLKQGNPTYAEAMQPVSAKMRLYQYLQRKFNLKSVPNEGLDPSDVTASNIKSSLSENKAVTQGELSDLKDATGYDTSGEAQNQQYAQQFDGSFANGSRRVNTFGATGAGIGTLAGGLVGGTPGAIAAGAVGGTVGSWVGAAADKEGGAWAKNILDYYLKTNPSALGSYASTLAQAASRGPTSLAATHFILQQTDPAYREKMSSLENSTNGQ